MLSVTSSVYRHTSWKGSVMDQPTPVEHIHEAVRQLKRIKDPELKATETTAFLKAVLEANEEVKLLRQEACIALVEKNWNYQQVADLIGVGKARASQILTGWRTPRRPGVIEQRMATAVAELRAQRATDKRVARTLVPEILRMKGGDQFSLETIAHMLEVSPEVVAPLLEEYSDHKPHKKKAPAKANA